MDKHIHVSFAVSLFLVERYDLTPETGLSVTVRVNPRCPNAVYPVLASFGTQRANGSTDCNVQDNVTDSIKFGDSVTLTTKPEDIPLEVGQNYCFVLSSNEDVIVCKWLYTYLWLSCSTGSTVYCFKDCCSHMNNSIMPNINIKVESTTKRYKKLPKCDVIYKKLPKCDVIL